MSSPNLVAPYSYLLNASYARPLPKSLTIEVGYIGRLAARDCCSRIIAQPLTRFKDPSREPDLGAGDGVLRDAFESGVTPAQVQANPSTPAHRSVL